MKINNIKKNLKKTELSILIAVAFQIILMMNMTPAYSYIIHQTDPLNEILNISGKNVYDSFINTKDTFKISAFFVDLLREFFSIKQIGIVSAEASSFLKCCVETNNGGICQDIFAGTESDTEPNSCLNPLPTKCEQTSSCEEGCCFDANEGLCTTMSPRQRCGNDGGIWSNDNSCSIQECQKGCCVLGDEVQFMTKTRCGVFSSLYGFEEDFRDINIELDCLALGASQDEGACVFDEGICNRNTETECLLNGGVFFNNYLCSHLSLETNCEKQDFINCVEGKDEIYWFDDCGNKENIYSSDKDISWNGGMILSKEDSCNSNTDNVNSKTCGNCDYFLGSKCSASEVGENSVQDGNYICKEVNCIDEWGEQRKNGESWCVYDGYIGDGKDTVGSRHWKRMCVDGEIKVEQCDDYRGRICAESTIEENGQTFSMASCIMNEATLCKNYNSKENMEELCNENKDCMIKSIDLGDFNNFVFNVCTPRYPRGFNLRGNAELNNNICSVASQTCIVVYEKDIVGDWECEYNCECRREEFTKQMNDWCVSLGDCGTYVNYVGGGTDNSEVTGDWLKDTYIPWTDYKSYANVVPGQHAEPKDIRTLLGAMTGEGEGYEPDDIAEQVYEWVGGVSGALGALGSYGIFGATVTTVGATTTYTTVGVFSSVFIGAAIGAAAGYYLAEGLDRTGDGALALVISGAVLGVAVVILYYGISQVWNVVGWVLLIVSVLFMAYIWAVGWGETREDKVKFKCRPWQAPLGGDDCEKCNEDPLRPCTKYRCESLGQACKLLNENEENPPCESVPREVNPPVISLGNISSGYNFVDEETKKVKIVSENRDDGCIPEFTPVLFELNTDEFAQCKFDFQKTSNYEDMYEYPLEQNAFTERHTFAISMPSLDSFSIYNVSGNLIEEYGNMNLFVRCQDYFGNFNIDEYAVNFCINSGPDLTAATILKMEPANGFYLAYGANETNLTIYLSEPAECKYDLVEGKEYDLMSNSMQCETDLTDNELYGWPCSANLKDLGSENKFYIKCKDQPWIASANYNGDRTEEDRNVNQEDYSYIIYTSETELKIDSVLPKGEIENGFSPVSVNLEVETSGGVDNGKARCEYKWGSNWIQFQNTFSSSHQQKGLQLLSGSFNIPLICEDDAGNTAESNIVFSTKIDESPPEVVRAYRSGNNLRLITDEEAECYYDFNKCNFNIKNSTPMTTAFSTEHITKITEQTYYIKCADIWGNTNSECAIKIRV